jgi:hypothetical protein
MTDAEPGPDYDGTDTIVVRVQGAQLVLLNRLTRRVRYVVVDAELMMTAQFPPAGAGVRIEGYTAESAAALVHWWPLPAIPGEPLASDDFVRTVEVRLRW